MSVEECAKKYPVSERSVYRYNKEVQDEKAGKTVEEKGAAGGRVIKTPQDLAVVTSKAPGPIIFRMGDQTIDLNPAHLYDAFRYCQDIKRIDPSIDDDFSLMVKAACKNAWEIFSEREARRVGAKIEIREVVR